VTPIFTDFRGSGPMKVLADLCPLNWTRASYGLGIVYNNYDYLFRFIDTLVISLYILNFC
jgi:hypothetical protein